ncbi:zinc ribbon domain-containing protein [candidate division WOR-3 bacterium]|nr:zinc ribbon domain-containing protein [candidate division WOR-3 bacterium]
MPVYEYKCEDCGRGFDLVASIVEKESGLSPACPRCNGMRVRQVFGRFTILSGSKTDSDDFAAGDEDEGMDDYGGGPTDGDDGFDDDGPSGDDDYE